jgi:hypothetical protein
MKPLSLIAALAALAVALAGHAAQPQPPKKDAPQPAGKTLFDGKSLEGWKSAGYVGSGKVHVKDGAIVMEKGQRMSGVAYAGKDFPKLNYEVAFEGKKLDGEDFFATATFPVGEDFCSLVVGGWGGEIVGLSSLNFLDASENETSTHMEFKKDRWYKVKIRVEKDRIQAWIDDKRLVDADTSEKKISIRFECDPCKPFGFCTYNTVGAVRDIKVRELTATKK